MAIEQTANQVQQEECPQCHSMMPVHRGYVTWCNRCGWNVQPHRPEPPRNVFEAMYLAMGKKLGRTLFDQIVREQTLQPTLTPAKLLAFAIAGLVHAFTLTLALFGVLLLLAGRGSCFLFAYGLLCLGAAWLLRPRLPALPNENLAGRDKFPVLYELADKIARPLGASSVDLIVVDGRFNAAFTRAGWRQRKVVFIGLPLFSILDPQERVALLGHELGHCVNGDATRGIFVGTAINSLSEWYRVLRPAHIQEGEKEHTAESLGTLIAMVSNVLLLALSQVPRLVLQGLLHLLYRDKQRAEYLADSLAAQAGGTAAALSLLDKLHMDDTVEMTIRRAMLNEKHEDLLGGLQRQVARVPEHERERIRQVERLVASRLDATHPPTVYRIDFLRSRPVSDPGILLPVADSERIDAELKSLERQTLEDLLESRMERLYH